MIRLDYNDLCTNASGIDYMAVLIVIEVFLLVLIFSKLGYDVRHYNRTGELPWLARHICLGNSKSRQFHNDWHPHVSQDLMDDPEDQHEDSIADNSIFLRCFSRHSTPSSDSGGQRSNGIFSLAFRPRRHTNSTSHSSSRMNVIKSPYRRPATKISNACLNHEADIIERCSSPRSAKLSSSEGSSNEVFSSRSKKISKDEANQFRKDILDPQVSEEDRPMIHQSECKTFRKISRLQDSNASLSGAVVQAL